MCPTGAKTTVDVTHVPEIDAAYRFNPDVTLAILAGFSRDRRVMVQGLHGTGKSTHIEQVAARLNWPCVRVNLDGHISRLDLVGKDSIVVRDGLQVTEFQEGIVPWALQRPVAANHAARSATVAALNLRLPRAFCQRSQRVPPSSRVK